MANVDDNASKGLPDKDPPPHLSQPPSFVEAFQHFDEFRSALLKTIDHIIQPYKIVVLVLSAALVGFLSFFGFKEWPDFKKSINDQITSQINSQLSEDFKNAQKQIEINTAKEITRMQVSVDNIKPEIDQRMTQALSQSDDACVKVNTKIALLDNSGNQCESKMKDALVMQERLQNEVSTLESKKSELEAELRGISADQIQLSAALQVAKDAAAKTGAEFQSILNPVKVQSALIESTQTNLISMMSDIDSRGKELAKTLGEDEFAVILKKMKEEIFRIQSTEARIQVSIPDLGSGPLSGAKLSETLCALQPNLCKEGQDTDYLEFRPVDPTTIGDTYPDGSSGTIYSETINLWEPFIEKVMGKPISVLNEISTVSINSPPIPKELLDKYGKDIDQFFSSVKSLKFQLFVNGIIVCERTIKAPKYHKFAGRDPGEVIYGFGAIDLKGNFIDARKAYEQRILAEDDKPLQEPKLVSDEPNTSGAAQ